MYQDYDRAANQVINHLTKRHCASSIIYMNKRCFRLFKEYMIEKNIEYSQELIIDWLEDCIRHLCSTTFRCYRLALFRLNDVLENRQIAVTRSPLNYQYLNKKGKELWGSFLVVDRLFLRFRKFRTDISGQNRGKSFSDRFTKFHHLVLKHGIPLFKLIYRGKSRLFIQ